MKPDKHALFRRLRRTPHIFAVGLAGLLTACSPPASNQSTEEKAASMERSSVSQKAARLSSDIKKLHEKLVDEKKMKAHEENRALSTALISQYIPKGTSFDEAEVLLKAAGFEVMPRGNSNYPDSSPERYAGYSRKKLDSMPMSLTEISVLLFPKSSTDYSAVINLTSILLTTYP